MFPIKLLASLCGLFVAAGTALAQDSGPLLDLLVKKGMLTDQEAEELRADLTKDFAANTAAGKMNLSSNLTEFRISGDIRARFESRQGELVNGDTQLRDRFRYRFRTGLAGKMLNNWAWGVRLETSNGSRSSNVTMADDGGPWAKGSDAIYLGQVWVQYTPTPEWTFTAGRMPNPFVTSSMVWDGDINPEGLAEQFKRRVGNVEYSATAAQLLYAGANTQNPFSSSSRVRDVFLFAYQGGVKVYLDGTTKFFQINPTLYTYYRNSGAKVPSAFAGVFRANAPAPVNDLTVFELPMEYNFMAKDQPVRLFADFAINLEGKERAKKFATPVPSNDNTAWQIGAQYGKAALKGSWDARVMYQSVGAFALDANLVDSDLFDSRTNMQGFIFSGNYALGAATQLTLTYADGERKNNAIIAPGAGDIGSNNALKNYRLLQVDLNLKY